MSEQERQIEIHAAGTPTSARDNAVSPEDERARRAETARQTREQYFGRAEQGDVLDWFWQGVLPGRAAACVLGVGPGTPEFLADMAARVTTGAARWLDGSKYIDTSEYGPLAVDENFGEDVVVVGSFADAVFDAFGGDRSKLWHLSRVSSFEQLIKVLNDARLWPRLLAIPNLHQIVPPSSLRNPRDAASILAKLTAVTSTDGAVVYGWPRSVRGPREGEHWVSCASATFAIQQRNGTFVVAGGGREFAFTITDGVLTPTTAPQAELTAVTWLEMFLGDGPKPRADVIATGAQAGFSERQLKYAATSLHVATPRAQCVQAGTIWELPGWDL